MLNKVQVKELYIKGFNAKEIAVKLDAKSDTVQRCINRNFSKHKLIHLQNRANYKSIISSINYQNKKHMSDSSLLRWNRQSYNYNEKYDLVFDEKTRGLKPGDMNSVIKNKI